MSKIGVCIKCLVEKKIQARGMCANCYRLETAPIGECIVCGKIRQLRSKSTCGSCYIKIRLAENPDKKNPEPGHDTVKEPVIQSPKKLTLAERIRIKLLKLAEDFDIVTMDDE